MNKVSLNIGLFIDTWYPMVDGVITVVDNYAKLLSAMGHTVTVFCPNVGVSEAKRDYRIVKCKSMKLLGLDYSLPLPNLDKKFKKKIKESNLDIIHIHSPFFVGKIGAKFAKKNKIPLVSTFHSQFKKDFYKATKSKALTNILLSSIVRTFNASDLLLTMNPACADLIKEYGYKGNIQLLPNGTNLSDKLDVTNEIENIKHKYNLTDEKILISVGRLVKLKNLDFTIDVCKFLLDNNFKFKLFIIGDGVDRNIFEKKVKSLKLQNNIIFTGKIYDTKTKSAFFKISDLHMFPSQYDTDGIVKIEAAGFNTPTIFTSESLASSSCTDKIDGYIEDCDIEKFGRKILEIFSDKNSFEMVQKNCKKNLYMTWEKIVDKLESIYYSLIKKEEKND
ncbi:MAG: glycosyltransferase [Firmicutes bacterium]|nr:glycosyltransferase [Bacillota bacterium]MDY3659223.1 glycosyltransferase [Eubacteriales bacterium]